MQLLTSMMGPLAASSLVAQRLPAYSPLLPVQHHRLPLVTLRATLRAAHRATQPQCIAPRVVNPDPLRDEATGEKWVKRHMCLLIGYTGTGYYGLQTQCADGIPGKPTISDELRLALKRTGAIAETNWSPLTRTKWTLASRTDKGVHAVGAAVSFKMETLDSQLDPPQPLDESHGPNVSDWRPQPRDLQLSRAAIAAINAELPSQVRVFGGSRVRKSFNPRGRASARVYEYLLPREAIGSLTIREFDQILSEFEGTMRYHNFCSGLRKEMPDWESGDDSWPMALDHTAHTPAAFRTVLACCVHRAVNVQGKDYLVLRIAGLSFVLHQIRHIVGAALAVAHGHAPVDVLRIALKTPLQVDVSPLAPGCGLLLDEIRWFDLGSGEDELVFREEAHSSVAAFKAEVVYPHIHKLYQEGEVIPRFLEDMEKSYFCNLDTVGLGDFDRLRRINENFQEYVVGKVAAKHLAAADAEPKLIKLLPGGLHAQICKRYRLLPGPRSLMMLESLKRRAKTGEVPSAQPYGYYLDLLEKEHGPGPPRPVVQDIV